MSEKNASRTVIGPDTVVNGEIHATQDLVVQGRVNGTLQVDAVLFVETGGVIEAEVKANHAVIAGTFQGTLEVVDALEVAETGRVMGRVQAPRMLVADGAVLNAELKMSGGFTPAAEVEEATEATLDTVTTRRSVYSYTLPATEKAPAAPAADDEAAVDADEPEVVEVAATTPPKSKKGGKKKS
jgi:cytoskeletal protein CcmA (bactofilin family)